MDADGDGVPDYLQPQAPVGAPVTNPPANLDSDNDGIPDADEGTGDTDGDGIIDSMDIDSDNDGVLDEDETARDSDNDGIPNYLDLDSDNDGLTDTTEAGGSDLDGDGIVDNFADTDNDGWDDGVAAMPLPDDDQDGDSVLDRLDVDSDNDGLPDLGEADSFASDADGDGRVDGFVDANSDGLDDGVAAAPIVVDDVDGDGIPDHLDIDTDNDGVYDITEAGGAARDANSDGLVDVPDEDGNGDGYTNILSDSQGRPVMDILPDFNNNNVPDVDEPSVAAAATAGAIQTGLAGSGCTINDVRSNDPTFWVMGFAAFSLLAWRRRSAALVKVSRNVNERGSATRSSKHTVLSVLFVASMAAVMTFTPTSKVHAQSSQADLARANCASDQQRAGRCFDDRLKRHIYAGIGVGASQLNPNTSQVDGVDVTESGQTGFQLMLGMDINRWISIELHGADLGAAGLTADGTIGYREFGASAMAYVGGARHRWKRHGITGFGRIGYGVLSNEASSGVDFEQVNAGHLLLGAGLEWMSRRGLGLRGEFISYEEDINYAQIGLIYRFGKRDRPIREKVVKQTPVKAPTPVAAPRPQPRPAPAPVAALKIADGDTDGVGDAIDRCPSTRRGVAVDEVGCAIFSGVIEGVNFDTNSAELRSEARASLDRVVATLKRFPNTRFVLSAHTDDQGDAASNKALSKRRAVSVAKYLMSSGINRNRFKAKAFGEERPMATNATAEGRRQNRRVELHVIR